MDERARTRLSKYLSKHLRHAPERIGITLQPGGWVGVNELIAACDKKGRTFSREHLNEVVANDSKPGRTRLWEEYEELRDRDLPTIGPPGIGTPDHYFDLVKGFDDAGVDQLIFLQQCGKNRHDQICESLELFGREVLPHFETGREEREARKAEELAPYIEKALGRKQWMRELADDEIPVVKASREREAFYRRD